MAYCMHCGAPLEPSGACPCCGRQQSAPPPVQPPATASQYAGQTPPVGAPVYQTAPPAQTIQEFCTRFAPASLRRNILASAICLYVCAGLGVFLAFIVGPLGLVDAALYLVCGLLIHLRKSLAWSIVALAYGVFSMLLNLVLNGAFTSWLVVLAGVLAVVNLSRLRSYWKYYQQTGMVPDPNSK